MELTNLLPQMGKLSGGSKIIIKFSIIDWDRSVPNRPLGPILAAQFYTLTQLLIKWWYSNWTVEANIPTGEIFYPISDIGRM